jgi:hypothetical protein
MRTTAFTESIQTRSALPTKRRGRGQKRSMMLAGLPTNSPWSIPNTSAFIPEAIAATSVGLLTRLGNRGTPVVFPARSARSLARPLVAG